MLTRSADRGIVELTCSPPYDEALASALLAACEDIVEAPAPLTAAVLRLGGSSEPSAPGWPEAVDAVASLPLPTVAVLADDTIGPTWELALACDLRIAASAARLGVSEVPPPSGTARRLAGMVGTSMALRLVLFGEVLDAAAAMELGLVQRVAEDVEAVLAEIVAVFRASAPIALAYVKEAVCAGMELPLADGLRLEADLAALLHTTQDRGEGIHAFLERRQPEFVGR